MGGPGTTPPPYVRLTTRTSIYTTQHYTRPRPQLETTTRRTPLNKQTEATLRPSTEYGTKPMRNPPTARPPSQYGVGSPPPSRPEDYMAVIPYRDINKLFELLNKHVNQPVSYPKHEMKKTKKKKKKEKVKTRITNFRIPQIKRKKPQVIQRKKIVERCANDAAG